MLHEQRALEVQNLLLLPLVPPRTRQESMVASGGKMKYTRDTRISGLSFQSTRRDLEKMPLTVRRISLEKYIERRIQRRSNITGQCDVIAHGIADRHNFWNRR